LTELAYRCYPDGCPRGRTCCVGLVVEVSRREVRAIDTLMDELARLVPVLREGRGFANVFVDDALDLVIEPREGGAGPVPFLARRAAAGSPPGSAGAAARRARVAPRRCPSHPGRRCRAERPSTRPPQAALACTRPDRRRRHRGGLHRE